MKHDGKIDIATGMSAGSRVWKNKSMLFSDFAKRLSEENKTNETHREFMACNRTEQTKIKDVGGYVGGYLRNGRRGIKNVIHKQLLTLDIDFAHLAFWDDFCLQFGNAAILHGTHKHSDASPRYRLLIPLSREVTPDEYGAISRQIAGTLGIELFDNTTFETNRLMFWQSNPRDIDYYYKVQDGPWVDADEVLASYIDWTDTSLWPTATKKLDELAHASKKQEDPSQKKGIVGAFCRTFTITEAIDKFLGEMYVSTVHEDRYTYTKGSTAAGLIIYDDTFAYSHHGTDPCSGKLSNVFDLVRLQLFGHLDGDVAIQGKPHSYKAMEEWSRKDKEVKTTLATENLANAKYDFADYEPEENDENIAGDQDDVEWMTELDIDGKGVYLSSATNINIILANDYRLKDAFKQNDFDNKRYAFRTLPWRKIVEPEPMKNVDYSGVRNYIESIYGISGTLKIDDSLALEFEKHAFHPIREYLRGLTWDGKKRVDTLLTDYLGVQDNIYTRESIRKWLLGAVSRVMRPGCKFDSALILVGVQGANKSSFLNKLGKEWFSDTFMTVHGTQALEQIQGAWIIEMAELAGLKKAEVEPVKHFISKQVDSFRPAYARVSETFRRQCVFGGTTNKHDFLNDATGGRRFWPQDVDLSMATKDVWVHLDDEVDQIWAEAFELFKKGETLILSKEAELIARNEQILHSETDERKGIIEQYLDKGMPKGWDDKDLMERRMFVEDPLQKGKYTRQFVCMGEIWCECLGKNKEDMTRYNTREINDILKGLEDWKYHTSTKTFKLYGKQKYYSRDDLS